MMWLRDSQIQTSGKVVTGTGQSEKEVEGKQDRSASAELIGLEQNRI